MRRLLIITTIFLSSLIMTSLAHAEWTQAAKSVTGNTFYVDWERIKKHDGKVYYWRLLDYLKPTIDGDISSKTYFEAECGRFRFRYLNATFYTGPMGEGTVSTSVNTPEKDWRYPSPNSVDESILKAVCNYKSMQ